MLLGLIFRGVAFEFRFRTKRWRPVWDWGFALGSTIAAFMQGIALGALVQGIEIADRHYAGGWWDWLTPFSVLTGVAVVVGYALLGATWLNLKTTGALQDKARRLAIVCRRRHAGADRRRQPVDAVPRRRSISSAGSAGRRRSSRPSCRCCSPSAPSACGTA